MHHHPAKPVTGLLLGLFAAFLSLSTLAPFAIGEDAAEAQIETAAGQTAEGAVGPEVEFSELEWDFGEVFQGDEASHIFKIHNKGDEALEILNVRSSCGCTAAILSEKTIQPGEYGEVKATYDTKRGRGRVTKFITVTTNDPDEADVKLKVSLDIKVEVEVVPQKAFFGNIFREEKNVRELKISSGPLPEVRINKVEIDNPHVTHSVKNATDGSNAKILVLELKDSAPLGRLTANAAIHTNSEKQPVTTVPIMATVYGDLEVKPTRLYLSPHNEGETQEGRIIIHDRQDGNSLEILSAVDKDGFLDLVIEPVRNGREFAIVATTKSVFPEGRRQGHYSGTIEVRTNKPGEENLTVSYNGYIKPPLPSE